MSKTVQCPHTPSNHDGHPDGSVELRECRERERVRIRGLRLLRQLRMMSARAAREPLSDGPSLGG